MIYRCIPNTSMINWSHYMNSIQKYSWWLMKRRNFSWIMSNQIKNPSLILPSSNNSRDLFFLLWDFICVEMVMLGRPPCWELWIKEELKGFERECSNWEEEIQEELLEWRYQDWSWKRESSQCLIMEVRRSFIQPMIDFSRDQLLCLWLWWVWWMKWENWGWWRIWKKKLIIGIDLWILVVRKVRFWFSFNLIFIFRIWEDDNSLQSQFSWWRNKFRSICCWFESSRTWNISNEQSNKERSESIGRNPHSKPWQDSKGLFLQTLDFFISFSIASFNHPPKHL